MNITITTYHPALPFFMKDTAPQGVSVLSPPVIERRDMGQTLHEIFITCAGIGKDVAVGLFSTWLYDRIQKHGAESVEIDGRDIPITEADIQAAIEVSAAQPGPQGESTPDSNDSE